MNIFEERERHNQEMDILEAKHNIAWYEREVVVTKYGSKSQAIEGLGTWEQRLKSLEKRGKKLVEKFNIYKDKYGK